ncbi:LysR family transcriptional regulator [Rhizobium sp. 32-5/1]|uniref:LysR family transcriptional regulator n=1 Tax=Rhizobium sp. 32-5/1 TaxID=3019602 RepID=UPI00240DD067|nr:LysR family transcriptional regulator [Rhizobium sp. 32-5/1]WEZ83091.1 LysR family transcriptional regulator [Rhizobium sp. 32-5/1]
METLANLECFVRSAETGGFSSAARRLALTPAAVSRNVAVLERNLGVRLFQRSTRKLTLTEDGERFLASVDEHLDGLQAAIANVAASRGEPAGMLRVSLSPSIGANHILPALPEFLARYPGVRADWVFENRQSDLIAEGLDAAIGGGFPLSQGVVSRTLAPVHLVAVASPDYMKGRRPLLDPADLSTLEGIVMRSTATGRVRQRQMRNAACEERPTELKETVIFNDPAMMVGAALLGLGVSVLAMPDVLSHLESGRLVRLLPLWYADAGPISIYYANRTLLPTKTRVFIDFIAEHFRRERLAERFAGSLG